MTYGENSIGAFLGSGDMSQLPAEYDVQVGSDAFQAPNYADWNSGVATPDANDPNYGIYQGVQNSQSQQYGQYGYDAGINQNMSASDMSAFIGSGQAQQAYQGMYGQQQPQPQFQQPQFQQPQFQQPQYQQPQYQQPQQQGYPQNFNPNFGQPNGQPQQFQQPQQNQNLTPGQFFQVPPMQNPQQVPAGYPQGYQQQQPPTMGMPQQPQFLQQPQPQQPGYPAGYPTAPLGIPQQQWQTPAYMQQQGIQPQQQRQYDPTTGIQSEISGLEEKIAANQLALTSATNLNDQDSMMALARENARLSGQLTAAYVRQQNVAEQYATTQLAGVRADYTREMSQMLQSYFGYTPQQADLQEFAYMMDMIATPETAASLQTPAVRDMVLKSYAFDKMTRMQGQRPQQAPRDYIPQTGSMGMMGGQNNFGAGQPRNQPVGFDALTERQRTQFLVTGQIPR